MASDIGQAIHYIKTHWKEGKTLKEVAQMHQVDPGNLARAFRTRKGTTVRSFVDEMRKRHVVNTLEQSSEFGYEIGSELGFASELAFYRWAKRAFGVPFSRLRSRIRDKKE